MKRNILIASLVLVIGIVGFSTVHWASRPSSTTQSNVGNEQDTGVLGSNSALTPFASPYFSTQVPATMQLKTSNENPHNAIRANYLFTGTAHSPADQLAITVGAMGLNSLSETPGVKLRLNDPATYQPVNLSNAPEGAFSFKRSEGYESAVFWQKGDLYVALVVSGSPLRQADLDQTMQSVLTNLSWR